MMILSRIPEVMPRPYSLIKARTKRATRASPLRIFRKLVKYPV